MSFISSERNVRVPFYISYFHRIPTGDAVDRASNIIEDEHHGNNMWDLLYIERAAIQVLGVHQEIDVWTIDSTILFLQNFRHVLYT